jgi:hypothetical protein
MPRRRFLGLTPPRSPIAIAVMLAIIPLAWGFNRWATESAHARRAAHWTFVTRDRGVDDGAGACGAGTTERFSGPGMMILSDTPLGRRGAIFWVVRWCVTPQTVSRLHYGFRVVGRSDPETGQPVPGSLPGVFVTKQPPLVSPAHARYRWIVARHGCRSCTISFVLDVTPAGVAVHARHVA